MRRHQLCMLTFGRIIILSCIYYQRSRASVHRMLPKFTLPFQKHGMGKLQKLKRTNQQDIWTKIETDPNHVTGKEASDTRLYTSGEIRMYLPRDRQPMVICRNIYPNILLQNYTLFSFLYIYSLRVVRRVPRSVCARCPRDSYAR